MRKKMEFRNMKAEELQRKREQNKLQKESNRQAIQLKKDERKRQVEEDAKMMKDQKTKAVYGIGDDDGNG